jgi:hypothetical protein
MIAIANTSTSNSDTTIIENVTDSIAMEIDLVQETFMLLDLESQKDLGLRTDSQMTAHSDMPTSKISYDVSEHFSVSTNDKDHSNESAAISINESASASYEANSNGHHDDATTEVLLPTTNNDENAMNVDSTQLYNSINSNNLVYRATPDNFNTNEKSNGAYHHDLMMDEPCITNCEDTNNTEVATNTLQDQV